MRASTSSNSFVQRTMSVVCAILLSLGLAGCRGDTPDAGSIDATQDTALPNATASQQDQEAEFPEQVTRPLPAEEMSAALARAVQDKDVLLLDRIARCTKSEDIRNKAEDEINSAIQWCQEELISQTHEGRITIPRTSGLALGSEHVGLGSMSIDSLSCEAKIGETPSDGIKVIIQKVNLQDDSSPPAFISQMPSMTGTAFRPTRTSASVEYAVLVGEGVERGEYRLAFEIVFTSDIERVTQPVTLSVNVLGHPFSGDEVTMIYGTISSLQRHQGRILKQSLESSDDIPLSELDRLLNSVQELHRKQVLLVLFLRSLVLSDNREAATAARQCLRIADEKWAEWRDLGDEQ